MMSAIVRRPNDVEIIRKLELQSFTLGPTGLLIKGTPTYEEWAGIGDMLRMLECGVHWIIGDWLIYGEGAYGEKAAQVIDATEWSAETVRNYRWACQKVPRENRRPDLTFSHHVAVAALLPSQQRDWLEKAAEGDTKEGVNTAWSSQRLKGEIQAATNPAKTRLVYELVIEFDQPADRDIVAADHQRHGRQTRSIDAVRAVKEEKE